MLCLIYLLRWQVRGLWRGAHSWMDASSDRLPGIFPWSAICRLWSKAMEGTVYCKWIRIASVYNTRHIHFTALNVGCCYWWIIFWRTCWQMFGVRGFESWLRRCRNLYFSRRLNYQIKMSRCWWLTFWVGERDGRPVGVFVGPIEVDGDTVGE